MRKTSASRRNRKLARRMAAQEQTGPGRHKDGCGIEIVCPTGAHDGLAAKYGKPDPRFKETKVELPEWKPPYRIAKVLVNRQDNFTKVVVLYENGKMGIGVSKCHESDVFNLRTGVKVAIRKAAPIFDVHELSDEVFKTWAERTLTSVFDGGE